MRRALLVLSILSLLAPAHAQVGSPEVTTTALPLTVTTTLERATEIGCSQSSETTSARATVHLAIGPGGRAELRLDGELHETMGPSPGRYMAGDHEFTRLTELHQITWSGMATLDQTSVTITFDHVRSAEARFQGYGTLPLPAPTDAETSAQLHCALAQTDVLPAEPLDGEHASPLQLLRCEWAGPIPTSFSRYSDTSFTLGAGAGVRESSSYGRFSSGTDHQVRFAR